jgi:2-polyprenyl-3-methyl-5-hydroxy-6-metoxy-1,4-benzoquinol methylase
VTISDDYFDRFETKKYRAKNPVKRALIRRFVSSLHELFESGDAPRSVLEIGVGEGFLSGFLSERFPDVEFSGVDLNERDLALLAQKFPRIKRYCANIYDLSALPGGYDLIICAEVLEHVDEPERALEQIVKLAPKRVILTVPHEPWFMLSNLAMGKNVTRLGNDIEHVNHFTVSSFRRLLARRLELSRVTTSYPWILAAGRPKS